MVLKLCAKIIHKKNCLVVPRNRKPCMRSNINNPGFKPVNDIFIGILINLYSGDILLERQANKRAKGGLL